MAETNQTHYQILGVTRNAKPAEIRRAYDRLRAKMRDESAPPDPRRVVLLQNACDVLCDEARRAVYDESLREGPRLPVRRRTAWIAAGLLVALALAAIFHFRSVERREAASSEREILSAASVAVGRVHAVDMAGQATPLGLAFAVGEGRLLMACAPLAPNHELVVRIGTRDIPARAADVSGASGYCTLSAPGTGSWPLAIAAAPPREGDKVYATRVSESGELSLAEGRVSRIERDARGAVLEASGDASREERGGPLLDAQGRVIAISDGGGRYAAIAPGAAAAGRAALETPRKG